MNKVKPINVGLTLAGTVVVTYLVCALVVAFAPGVAEALLKLVAHSADVDMLFHPEGISFANVLGGTVVVAVYFFLTGAIFGFINNLFAKA